MHPWLLIIVTVAAGLDAATTVRPGQVIERVACAANPDQQYALYVPSSYTAARHWPIVFAMDARGNALRALAPFREAAERRGYIVASSWNTASDGAMAPNVEALNAMWKDTHARLAVDDRRVYAAGFSGTARAAVALAVASPGTLTGVIASGAGYPEDRAPAAGARFDYFIGIGRRDFNYSEIQKLEPKLLDAGIVHRIEEFDGEHEWIPPGGGDRALAWLDLMAMRRGLSPGDARIVDASWTADLDRAASLGTFERRRLLSGMISYYDGLKDSTGIRSQLAALDRSPELKQARTERDRQMREERQLLDRAKIVLSTSRDVRAAIRDLGVEELQKRTDDVAARVLNTVLVQTSFYLPAEMRSRRNYARAALLLGIAATIAPKSAWVATELAAAHAENGDRAAAIASLRRAIELGLEPGRIATDDRFAAMRETAEFRAIAVTK